MEWSLVLASQDIGHRIDQDEASGWTLSVSAADHDRALTHLRLYRQENRRWQWRRPVTPGLFFDWTSLVWVSLILVFYAWSEARAGSRTAGMLTVAALSGEGWRLFTATWLHADLAHLSANAVFGFLFLGLAMGRYGPGVGLLAAYLAGVGGNALAGWVHDATARGLGASGVVMGALGLLAIPAAPLPQRTATFRMVAGSLMAAALLFVFLGASPESDVIAHLGGFAAGLLLGSLLTLTPRLVHRPPINLAAGLLFVVLVILPWWWAMRSGSGLRPGTLGASPLPL